MKGYGKGNGQSGYAKKVHAVLLGYGKRYGKMLRG
jgi:hypothetical protein